MKSSGSAHIFGYELEKDSQHIKKTNGYVPQYDNFDRYYTVMDALLRQGGYFGLSMRQSRDQH